MSHLCHAAGCQLSVPPKMLMCKRHWYMVPIALRHDVWREYRPGQERDKHPSEAYLMAMRAAIEAVSKKEGRT